MVSSANYGKTIVVLTPAGLRVQGKLATENSRHITVPFFNALAFSAAEGVPCPIDTQLHASFKRAADTSGTDPPDPVWSARFCG